MKRHFTVLSLGVLVAILSIPVTHASQTTSKPDLRAEQAVGSTRSLNTAEVFYAKTFKKGFSPTLASLGVPRKGAKPSASKADLLDNSLTSGRRNHYVFTYTAGALDADGTIKTYTFTARPAKWHQGMWSFFTDETAIIRGTAENRTPTANDPPLK